MIIEEDIKYKVLYFRKKIIEEILYSETSIDIFYSNKKINLIITHFIFSFGVSNIKATFFIDNNKVLLSNLNSDKFKSLVKDILIDLCFNAKEIKVKISEFFNLFNIFKSTKLFNKFMETNNINNEIINDIKTNNSDLNYSLFSDFVVKRIGINFVTDNSLSPSSQYFNTENYYILRNEIIRELDIKELKSNQNNLDFQVDNFILDFIERHIIFRPFLCNRELGFYLEKSPDFKFLIYFDSEMLENKILKIEKGSFSETIYNKDAVYFINNIFKIFFKNDEDFLNDFLRHCEYKRFVPSILNGVVSQDKIDDLIRKVKIQEILIY